MLISNNCEKLNLKKQMKLFKIAAVNKSEKKIFIVSSRGLAIFIFTFCNYSGEVKTGKNLATDFTDLH